MTLDNYVGTAYTHATCCRVGDKLLCPRHTSRKRKTSAASALLLSSCTSVSLPLPSDLLRRLVQIKRVVITMRREYCRAFSMVRMAEKVMQDRFGNVVG